MDPIASDGERASKRDAARRLVRRATKWFVAGTAGLLGVTTLYVSNALPGRSTSSDAGSSTPTTTRLGAPATAPVAPPPTAPLPRQPVTRTRGS